MRVGWQSKALGQVLLNTQTVNPALSPEKEFDYIDVSSVCNETYRVRATQRVSGRNAPSRARRLVRSGDVLFATIRPTLKRIAIIPEELDGQVCSTGYFVLRAGNELDNRFLFYSLFSENFMGAMQTLQKGASYPAVTDAEVRAQSITYPPITEQRRIVGILDEAFEGIATAKVNAERSLDCVHKVFESQLSKVFSATEELVPLHTLATDITDGDHMPPPKAATGVPFITISNIVKRTRTIDFTSTFLVSPEYFSALKPNRKPRRGDVLYTVTGATLGIPVLVDHDVPFCFQRHIALIRPRIEINSEWLNFVMSSPQVFSQATRGATGAAQKTVSLSVLRSIKVPRQSQTEQFAVAAQLSALFDEKCNLEDVYRRKVAALAELKQSLLHQAFTGQLTAKSADREFAEVA